MEGERLIQKIFQLAQNPEFCARIAFVENYDQRLAQRMVRGVDVWLNNPIPPLEASGTSGMKAVRMASPIFRSWMAGGSKATTARTDGLSERAISRATGRPQMRMRPIVCSRMK